MRGLYCFCIWLAAFLPLSAQLVPVPDSLLTNADAVVRYDSTFFKVISPSQAQVHYKYAITIRTSKKASLAELYLDYDPFQQVSVNEVVVLDAQEKVTRKVKRKDFQDISLSDGISMALDNRALAINLKENSFPFTIMVDYVENMSGTMFYPNWSASPGYNVAVQQSYFSVEAPVDCPVRFYEKNIHYQDSVIKNGKIKMVWESGPVKPKSSEIYSKGLVEMVPMVFTAPTQFEMAGYKGNLSTWESYGQWINSLNAGRSTVSPALEQTILNLTNSLETDLEKIQAVYKYVQRNTRYISIQLGIGGWQPLPASFVEQKGYGDCKALSNYTKSLLEIAGVTSHYTLIRAGTGTSDLRPDFPSAYFNHAILCVPNNGDTVWLECTSQSTPTGYQGLFTGNRHALIITPEGGKVVPTRRYDAQTSVLTNRYDVSVSKEGGVWCKGGMIVTGVELETGGIYYQAILPKTEQEDWFRKFLDLNSVKLENLEISIEEKPIEGHTGRINTQFTAASVGKMSGNRMFFKPSFLNTYQNPVLPKTPRESNIYRKWPYQYVDDLVFEPPVNFYPESLPKDVDVHTDFGVYTRETTIDNDGKIHYRRVIQFVEGEFPPSRYGEFSDFLRQIGKLDSEQVVLVNKT